MEEKSNHKNDLAHRHGEEKPEAEQRAAKLSAAVEAAHEAVFGEALSSGSSSLREEEPSGEPPNMESILRKIEELDVNLERSSRSLVQSLKAFASRNRFESEQQVEESVPVSL